LLAQEIGRTSVSFSQTVALAALPAACLPASALVGEQEGEKKKKDCETFDALKLQWQPA
jgi:hypothetical protein